MKRIIYMIIASLMMSVIITGCDNKKENETEKVSIIETTEKTTTSKKESSSTQKTNNTTSDLKSLAKDLYLAANTGLIEIDELGKWSDTQKTSIISSDSLKDYDIPEDFDKIYLKERIEHYFTYNEDFDWFTIFDEYNFSSYAFVANKSDHSKVGVYKADTDIELSFINESGIVNQSYDVIYDMCVDSLKNLSNYNVDIQEQELYSDNNVKIVAKSLDSDFDGCKVKIYIENNSDLNLIFDPRAYSVNGIMVERSISEAYDEMTKISSGSKINAFLTLKYSFLQKMAIKQIKYIDVMFKVRENDSFFDGFNTGQLRILTSLSDNSRDDIDGKVLYDNGGINVKFLNNTGNTFKYIITNNTSNYFLCDIDEVNINGFSFSDLDIYLNDIYILNECQSVISLQPDEKFLKDNDISKIEKIDFKLVIRPNDDYYSEYKTDKISHNCE